MTEDWPARVRRLEEEVSGLRKAMRTRSLIEQAKGMLAERMGCDPETAFDILSARSQQTNVPLVTVAADLVTVRSAEADAAASPPVETPAAALPETPVEPLRLTDLPDLSQLDIITGVQADLPSLAGEPGRRLRLAIAAMDAATDLAELTNSLVNSGLGNTESAAAAIFVAEPDGALRQLASYGWDSQMISDWRRVPSSVNTSVAEAIRSGRPVVLDGRARHDYVLIGPGQVRVVFPLGVGRRMIGALQFGWPVSRRLSPAARLYLVHLAAAAARPLRRLLPAALQGDAAAPASDLDWMRSVLEALHGHAQLLSPVRAEDGQVEDFVIDATTGQPADLECLGRRLLDVHPDLAANGVFDAYRQVLADGRVWQQQPSYEEIVVKDRRRRILVSRRAGRIGNAVLASWERMDEAVSRDRHLARMEAFGGFGWGEWNLDTAETRWSPGMFKLWGRNPAKPAPALEALADLIDPADADRAHAFLSDAAKGAESVVELRLAGSEGTTWLRLTSSEGPPESPDRMVQVLAQDVSERRRHEERLRSMQSRAAEGRLRLSSEQDLTSRLVRLLYPPETVTVRVGASLVAGRHHMPDESQQLRADFCDALELPDGRALLLIGDMFGTGVLAAATSVRIARPVISLALAELPLDQIMAILNASLLRDDDFPLASLQIARFDAGSGDFEWASAGHLPPVLLRGDRAKRLTDATGPILGLAPGSAFTSGRVRLRNGDAVVCHTDGYLDPQEADPLRGLAGELLSRYRAGGLENVLDQRVPAGVDEACLLGVRMGPLR